ncbi:MAG: hypothetical protein HKN68_09610 [Saprospiraceae bacterium]|nr:hypothetical protein [Saprospiraceae bacterium]
MKEVQNLSVSNVAYPTIILTVVAMVIYTVTIVATIEGTLSTFWTILINTIAAYVLFTSMHEAGHLNISGNKHSLRWIDEIIGWLSGITLFAPFYIFKVLHFRHHAHTNDPIKDPDHWLASKGFIALIFHSTTIFPVYMVRGAQLLFHKKKITRKVKKELQIGFIGLFILIGLLIVAGSILGWSLVLMVWVIPAVIAQAFLALTFDWLPHHPHKEKARYKNTRIHDIPGLSFLFLGQNYHLIHHLYPRIPFYNYKKTYAEIKEELVENEVEIVSIND